MASTRGRVHRGYVIEVRPTGSRESTPWRPLYELIHTGRESYPTRATAVSIARRMEARRGIMRNLEWRVRLATSNHDRSSVGLCRKHTDCRQDEGLARACWLDQRRTEHRASRDPHKRREHSYSHHRTIKARKKRVLNEEYQGATWTVKKPFRLGKDWYIVTNTSTDRVIGHVRATGILEAQRLAELKFGKPLDMHNKRHILSGGHRVYVGVQAWAGTTPVGYFRWATTCHLHEDCHEHPALGQACFADQVAKLTGNRRDPERIRSLRARIRRRR